MMALMATIAVHDGIDGNPLPPMMATVAIIATTHHPTPTTTDPPTHPPTHPHPPTTRTGTQALRHTGTQVGWVGLGGWDWVCGWVGGHGKVLDGVGRSGCGKWWVGGANGIVGWCM